MLTLYYCFDDLTGRSPAEISSLEHQLGRRLLSFGLDCLYGLPFDEADLSFEPKGKPHLTQHPEIHFSISHCRGMVVCALGAQRVGVDAEAPRRRISEALRHRILSPEEQATLSGLPEDEVNFCFLRFWTLKEAYVKYLGIGISTDLQSVSFSFDDSWQPTCSDPEVTCYQAVLHERFLLSLCCRGQSEVALHEIPLAQLLQNDSCENRAN